MLIGLRTVLVLSGLLVAACAAAPMPGPADASSSTRPPSPVTEIPVPLMDNAVKTRALYYPSAEIYGDLPEGFKELTLRSADGLDLDAWYCPPPSEGFLLLYFHGNGGNLSSLGEQFEAFREAGAGVLAVDYRGFGKSQGAPSEAGLYLDSEAVYAKALELGYEPGRIVIYGRSLGGGVATYLASSRQAAGLILESTFTSVDEVARRSHGSVASKLVSGFPSLKRMAALTLPVLVIHGTRDDLIPPDMGRSLAEAGTKAELWMVKGAHHNNLRHVAGADYVPRLVEFLRSLQ